MEFDLENPLTSSDDDGSTAALFAAESGLAAAGLDPFARRDALSEILQGQFSSNLDPFVAYLAVTYVDRFLSRQQIPREKPWIARLLAIACVSLAAKMRKAPVVLTNLQREGGFIFDERTIRRMELLVLGALEWRMRSITPFCFLRFFLALFAPAPPALLHALRARAHHAVLKAQPEIKMLEYKPSMVAVAALLSAAHDLAPAHAAAFHSAVSSCEFVDKGRLWECCGAMADVEGIDSWDATHEMVSSSDTPVTVLCRGGPGSESDTTFGAASDGPDVKKRRLGLRSNETRKR